MDRAVLILTTLIAVANCRTAAPLALSDEAKVKISEPEPVLALIRNHLGAFSEDPWKEIPDLLIYEDGTILFKDGKGQPRVGTLADDELRRVLSKVTALGFEELPGFTDAVPNWNHQTLSYVLVRTKTGWKQRTRYGHSPTCEASNRFGAIIGYLSAVRVASSHPWEATEIEVSFYGPVDFGDGVPWAADLPMPKLPLQATTDQSASYTYIWPIRHEPRLRELERPAMRTFLPPGVSLGGRNWWLGLRHHVRGRPVLEALTERESRSQVSCPDRQLDSGPP